MKPSIEKTLKNEWNKKAIEKICSYEKLIPLCDVAKSPEEILEKIMKEDC